MRIDYSHHFLKCVARVPVSVQVALEKRVALFAVDRRHPILNVHPLHGHWRGFFSMNVTGDWRALYRNLGDGHVEWVEFTNIGTHSELYG